MRPPGPGGRTAAPPSPLTLVVRFWLLATALELVLGLALLLSGADAAVGRGLDATGLPFSTDLVTAVRLCIVYPAATLGVVLAVAQVAAPDLAVLAVARRVRSGPGSLAAVLARLRWRGPAVDRRTAARAWGGALLVLLAASLATAGLNRLVLGPQEHRWPALRTDLVPGADLLPGTAGLVVAVVAALAVTLALDAGALLEENGWRGFALPLLLLRFGPGTASVVLGLLWAAWHYPVKYDAFLTYGAGGGLAYLAAFTLKIVLLTAVITHFWLRVGGSTLLAIALHGLSNDALRLQGELLGDSTRLAVLSELTISAPLAAVVGVLLWRGRGRLGGPEPAVPSGPRQPRRGSGS